MKKKNLKFIIGSALIVVAIIWLGASGFQEGKAYYKTADELAQMGDEAIGKRIKVAGDVVQGSIEHEGRDLSFQIESEGVVIPIRYVGSAPIPDTFGDATQAVVEGTYTPNGVFEANTIQAKCASKYEADYTEMGGESQGI